MGRLKPHHFFFFAAVCFAVAHIGNDIRSINEKDKYKRLYEQTKTQLNACEYQFNHCKFLYRKGCE